MHKARDHARNRPGPDPAMVAEALGGKNPPAPDALAGITWRPLSYLNLLRIALAALMLGLVLGGPVLRPLGARDLTLFTQIAAAYLGFGLLTAVTIRLRRPRFRLQAPAQVCADIVAITALMSASGGVGSGLGILLVPVVAGGALLVSGRIAFFFAAAGTLALLLDQAVIGFQQGAGATGYTQTAMLGLTLFATAGTAYTLAGRARRSALLAEDRRAALAELARLNAEVIQRMQTGIVVADRDNRIVTTNPSAERLLARPLPPGTPLSAAAPELAEVVAAWRRTPTEPPASAGTGNYTPRFADLGGPTSERTLIFLEDNAALRQQSQLLKLAGLGRMAASIAHQIRNPLAAIRQASALLREAPALTAGGGPERLLDILERHTSRLEEIVQEVLALSRPREFQPQEIQLDLWLAQFRTDYAAQYELPAGTLTMADDGPLVVRFDPGQLTQVVGNLCDNARMQAADHAGLRIALRTRYDAGRERAVLECRDHGPGVPPGERERLFEPFHTTRPNGTGLGLYVARQLCELNQALLEHYVPDGSGAGFRITFNDARRQRYD